MDADTVLTAVVGLCCVLAIGATSTTLDSTVGTDPEEATDFNYDKVPIGTGPAQALDDALDSGRSDGAESGSSSSSSSSASGGSGSDGVASKPSADGDRTGQASSSGGGQQQDQHSGSSDGRQSGSNGGGGDRNSASSSNSKKDRSGDGTRLAEPSLLDRLLWLLQDLFDLLLAVLPWVVLAACIAAVYRYRDRFLGRPDPVDPDGGDGDAPPPDPSPDNAVASAWFEMVERLGLAHRRDLTPRECAAAASDRGVDPDAARSLTALFEEVRYGGARVTDERRRRAEETLSEVRSQLEGPQ